MPLSHEQQQSQVYEVWLQAENADAEDIIFVIHTVTLTQSDPLTRQV